MNAETTRLILTGIDAAPWRSAVEASAFGPFVVEEVAQWAGLQTDVGTVVLVAAGSIGNSPEDQRALARLAADIAVWVLVPSEVTDLAERLWRCGVDEVLTPDELRQPALPRRLRAAVERKRRAREERTTYATDLSTGLPHQQQLIEHMSHLMALREREPAPMAVLVLRVEGFATTEARLGREAANVLRRKLAVRLRAGVRASDVVAFIGADSFAVLLASILAPADAQRVGAKLLAALQVPFKVSGQDLALAVAVGVGHYPADGNQPEQLLRQAIALAAAPVQGRTGHANFTEAGGSVPAAANDE